MLCVPAHQAAVAPITIDFDGFASTSSFSGGTEDGFNLVVVSGQASVDGALLGPFSGSNSFHNSTVGGDTVNLFFFPTSGGLFELSSLMAGNAGSPGGFNETLIVRGFRGFLVGEDRFSAPSGRYASFTPTALAGARLDSLSIVMDPRSRPIHVDDIVLNTSPVPEPGTLMLVGLGMIGMGAMRRRRFFGVH